MLYKISKKTAGIGIISMNIFTILVFILVILKILPFNSISGGRLPDYEAAFSASILSIFIMVLGIPVVAIASELIKLGEFKNFFKVWLVFIFLLIAFLLYKMSIISAVITAFQIPLIAAASGLIKFEQAKIFFKIYLWLSFVMLCLNTVMNLLGVTLFEKIIMTLVTVMQAIFYFRLAMNKN